MSERWSTGRPAHLLRGHVADGPQHRARLGRGPCRSARSSARGAASTRFARPKSRIFTWPSPGHEHVVGLQVAVDDALRVRGREPLRDLERLVDGLALRHGRRVELAAQGLALEQLHDGVTRSAPACRSRGSRGCSDATAPRPPSPRARTAPAHRDRSRATPGGP